MAPVHTRRLHAPSPPTAAHKLLARPIPPLSCVASCTLIVWPARPIPPLSCVASCTLIVWSARLIPPLLFYMLRFILCEGEGSSNSCYIPCVWLYTITYHNVVWYGCRYVNKYAVVHVLNYIYMYQPSQCASWSIEPTIASYVDPT